MKLLRGVALVLIGASTAAAQQNWLLRTASGPSPRSHHAMAFDSWRGVTVLFGGSAGALQLNDTWEWDGDVWTQRQPAHSPQSGGRLVYDSARGVSVLVRPDETWEWDGTDWNLASASGTAALGAVYDPVRARTVVLARLTDSVGTWPAIVREWDGTTWHEIQTATGPFFTVMTMGWSDTQHRVLAYTPFQGFASPTAGARLWQWDGVAWTSNAPLTGPYNNGGLMPNNGSVIYGGTDGFSPIIGLYQPFSTTGQVTPASPLGRGAHAMVRDTVRDRLVLFGGYQQISSSAPQTLSGDTWEYVSGGGLVASSAPYGSGCGTPAPTMAALPGSRPVLGQTFVAEVADATLGATLVAFGPSNQVAQSFYGAPLPLDLGWAGLPGCPLLVSPDLLLTCGAGGTLPDFVLAVPNAPVLNGVQAYLQAFTFRAGANPASLVASDGLQLTLGDQ